jgi:hypothetical protein
MKLNLGSGRTPLEGWVNVDRFRVEASADVHWAMDLEKPCSSFTARSLDCVEEFQANHVLEHIANLLPLMQWCWELAKPGALFTARVPYGSSDDADADPTHVRRFFLESWGYFGQPHYWRADYGYRGDWQAENVLLVVKSGFAGMTVGDIIAAVQCERNCVVEMVAQLRAVKPAREAKRELQSPFQLDVKVQD